MLVHIFLRYFPRCCETSSILHASEYATTSSSLLVFLGDAVLSQSERITPTEIVFQFERYNLYNSSWSRWVCKPPWNPNSPRGKQQSEVSMLVPWAIVEIVTILLILNNFYIHIDKRSLLQNPRRGSLLNYCKFLSNGSSLFLRVLC